MKKVGIITSYLDFDKNYGGVLQAYALSKQISLLGYDAYIMPYIYEHMPRLEVKNDFAHKVFRFVLNTLDSDRRKMKKQRKLFSVMLSFADRKLPLYKKERMTVADMQEVAGDFHAFVCGSDQVWSTKLQRDHCDPGMFLNFVPEGVKRIAYAPSLGSTRVVSEETAEEMAESLEKFDAVSVREKAGAALIREVTGIDAPIVLDPTLLLPLKHWDEIATVPKNLPEKYILLYRFGDIPSNMEKIMAISKKLGLPIIELPSSWVSLSDGIPKRFDVDSGDFIGIIRNATLVLTDSFHATVFSILNKTPFVSFLRQEKSLKNNMNGRLTDLLETTGLEKRLCEPEDEIDFKNLFNLDFDKAHENIEKLRENSFKYLKAALSGEFRNAVSCKNEKEPEMKDEEKCSGCSACASACPRGAISMLPNEEGFLYPKIDEALCVDCGICRKVCAKLDDRKRVEPRASYTAYSKSSEEREAASSGGVFGALAEEVLSSDGVVFGVAFSPEDKKMCHVSTEEVSLETLKRSKYVQSDKGETFKEVRKLLDEERKVLYVGTPCEIVGLYSFLPREYDNLITMDFMCHGVPSPKLFSEVLLDYEKKHGSKVVDYTFREKTYSWRDQAINVYFENGDRETIRHSDFYYYQFLHNLTLRRSCFSCSLYRKHAADITVADHWRIDRSLDDDRGVSLVFINSEKGENVFEAVREKLNVSEYAEKNITVYSHRGYNREKRDAFYKCYIEEGFERAFSEYSARMEEEKAERAKKQKKTAKAMAKSFIKRFLGGRG